MSFASDLTLLRHCGRPQTPDLELPQRQKPRHRVLRPFRNKGAVVSLGSPDVHTPNQEVSDKARREAPWLVDLDNIEQQPLLACRGLKLIKTVRVSTEQACFRFLFTALCRTRA